MMYFLFPSVLLALCRGDFPFGKIFPKSFVLHCINYRVNELMSFSWGIHTFIDLIALN